MSWRRLAAGLAALSFALGQHGTHPKASPGDYPVRAETPGAAIGAEYLVRSVGTGDAMFIVPDHLVVEVAVYPRKGGRADVSAGQFGLRVNGKKDLLPPQPPSMVAAALKYPDWEMRPQVQAEAGIGDGTIAIGRPRRVGRFPGDTRPSRTQAPNSQPRQEGPEAAIVVESALPEGPAAGPVSGYLYFWFKTKPKSIKRLELVYDSGDGPVSLRFF